MEKAPWRVLVVGQWAASDTGADPAPVLEHGFRATPKSVHAESIAENFDVFGFSPSRGKVVAFNAPNTGVCSGPNSTNIDMKRFAPRSTTDFADQNGSTARGYGVGSLQPERMEQQ